MSEALKQYLARRDALFRNPTLGRAREFITEQHGVEPRWERWDVALASVHKGRLQWIDATDEMIAESLKWLADHGYENTWRGAPPFTPDRRDEERVRRGMPPMKGVQ